METNGSPTARTAWSSTGGRRSTPASGSTVRSSPRLNSSPFSFPTSLLRYQITSRLYGTISTRNRKRLGWIENPPTQAPPPRWRQDQDLPPPLPPPRAGPSSDGHRPGVPGRRDLGTDDESEGAPERRRNWARLIQRVWLSDPELCPACGQRLEVVAAISSPAQDGVIEKVLRSSGLWDPPWLRRRRARGPPAAHARNSPAAGVDPDLLEHPEADRLPEDEEYFIDAPAPDDGADPA